MLLFAFALVLLYFWKPFGKFYKGRKLPPGPIRWPVVGSIPQIVMVDTEYGFRQVMGLRKTYGDIMLLGLGVHCAVVLSSYKIIKDILRRPEASLARFRSQFTYQRTNGENLGIVWGSGEVWKQVRAYTVRTLRDFGFGKTGSIEETAKAEMQTKWSEWQYLDLENDSVQQNQ